MCVCVGGVSDAPLHALSVHFIQQWRGVSGYGHGRALDHGAGRRPRRHPLSLLPPLRLLLLQPLLRHLAPVHRCGAAAAGPMERDDGGGGGQGWEGCRGGKEGGVGGGGARGEV